MLTCGDAPRTPSGYGASGDCQGALSAVSSLVIDVEACTSPLTDQVARLPTKWQARPPGNAAWAEIDP
jgi:hypothetical protein